MIDLRRLLHDWLCPIGMVLSWDSWMEWRGCRTFTLALFAGGFGKRTQGKSERDFLSYKVCYHIPNTC